MDKKPEWNTNIFTLAINDLIDNIQDTFKKLVHQDDEHIHQVVNDLLECWLTFTRRAIVDQDQLAYAQTLYWHDYLLLCKGLNQRLSSPSLVLNRQAIVINFIEKFAFLISQHAHLVIKHIFSNDDEEASRKTEFFTRQFTEAFAQHNWAKTHSQALYQKLMTRTES